MSSVADQRFRLDLRSWIEESLPDEWRDISRGADDTEAVRIRRQWGVKLAEGGWGAPQWPIEHGGRDLSMEQQAIVLEELAASGAPEALNSNGIGICAPVLIRHGTQAQQDRYLKPMLHHDELWCQGFSEPQAGSDLGNLRTRGRVEGERIVVNGQKLWTSFAGHCDLCYALVRTDPDSRGGRGISFLVIDMRSDGVTIQPVRNIAGGREFAEVFLDDVSVPTENLIGPLHGGWPLAMEALALERGLSFAERAMRLKRELLGLRALLIDADGELDDPGADVRARIVDAFVAAHGLHSFVLRVIKAMNDPAGAGALASLAKLRWSERHQDLLLTGLDVIGDRAGTREHSEWFRASMFARGETIYGGTSEIQRNTIARHLGLPSSKAATR